MGLIAGVPELVDGEREAPPFAALFVCRFELVASAAKGLQPTGPERMRIALMPDDVIGFLRRYDQACGKTMGT